MRRRANQPVFGSAGTKLIEYTGGDGTGVFGPFVTRKVYRFRPGKNPRLVDARDLTLLTRAAGRENLRDVSAEQAAEKERLEAPPPKRVREKPKPVEKSAEKPVEQEEVDDAIS
jgi:hypothetical protein